MSFSSCPECGETNYYETSYSNVRHFDCGFKGQFGTRTARCGGKRKRSAETPVIEDSSARYRLALLDAAQVADTIAAEMVQADQSPEFVSRIRQLSTQMRAFAGHTNAATFEGLSRSNTTRRTGTALMAIFRRAKPW